MMKNIVFLTLCAMLVTFSVSAQTKYFTREGKVHFNSTAGPEAIEGTTEKAASVLEPTGKLEIAVLVKGIQFEKALMEEHFNENYLESDKYPKSNFSGQIVDIKNVNFAKDGTYPVTVKGKLTLHGVTNDLETKGQIIVKNGAVSAKANFAITVADYKVEIPSLVKDKVAKVAKIDVECNYQAMNK